jgi:hypothetical protein
MLARADWVGGFVDFYILSICMAWHGVAYLISNVPYSRVFSIIRIIRNIAQIKDNDSKIYVST